MVPEPAANLLLSAEEIHRRFPSEWILVENPETDESLNVLRGLVRFHSPDRDTLYRLMLEARSRNCAILFTGTTPPGMEFALAASHAISPAV